MKNFCIFADAVNYIEENLCNPITQNDIAAACCCSLSTLQKVWNLCTHTTLKEYISKRRLARSAEDILNTEMTLTEIAMKYQYNSPEVFSRAFRKLWSTSPSNFKKNFHSSGFFPRIVPDETKLKGGIYMGRRVDISQLYDELQAKTEKDSYVLCFDIVGLDTINKNIGRNAGDCVILEAFRRIDAMAGGDMMAFRVGGDEFAVVTGISDKNLIDEKAAEIIAQNGQKVECGGAEIPVSLRISAIRLTKENCRLKYFDLFERMQEAMIQTKEAGKVVYFD